MTHNAQQNAHSALLWAGWALCSQNFTTSMAWLGLQNPNHHHKQSCKEAQRHRKENGGAIARKQSAHAQHDNNTPQSRNKKAPSCN
jgi:hypothetical protein